MIDKLFFFFKEKKCPMADELYFSERRHLKLLRSEELSHKCGWLEQSVFSRGS